MRNRSALSVLHALTHASRPTIEIAEIAVFRPLG